MAALEALSVSELRALLTGANVKFADCVEKADLVRRARAANLKPGDARRASGAAAGAAPNARGGAAGAARPDPDAAGARGPTAGTPKERELVERILRTKDFYELLGVPRTASDDDIKKAYRKLVLTLHPDKCRAAKAEDAFKHLTKAYEVLSDPATRQQHDRFGPEAVSGNGGGVPNPFAGFGGGMGGGFPFGGGFAGPGGGHYPSGDVEELLRGLFGTGGAFGGAPGFAGGFGGGAPRPQQRQQQQRPAGAQQQQPQPGAGLAGLNLHQLLPFLPVLLMVLGQALSVVPFLMRNLQLLGVLYYACPHHHRGTLLRLFGLVCVLQMFVL